jgi:hypothetical protein
MLKVLRMIISFPKALLVIMVSGVILNLSPMGNAYGQSRALRDWNRIQYSGYDTDAHCNWRYYSSRNIHGYHVTFCPTQAWRTHVTDERSPIRLQYYPHTDSFNRPDAPAEQKDILKRLWYDFELNRQGSSRQRDEL